jgi:hypothetical protein
VFGWVGAEKENLCLYGYANEAWEVALPAEEVPTELPEPALGINFARDGMNRRDWLALVAVHSDSWLVSVAFYYAARLNRNDRYDTIPPISPLFLKVRCMPCCGHLLLVPCCCAVCAH